MTSLSKVPFEAVFQNYATQLSEPEISVLRDLLTLIGERETNLAALFGGGLGFSENFAGAELSYTTNATPDTQDTVAHGLKIVPTGFLAISINKPGVVYKGAAFDATNVYFKCNVASADVVILVF